MAGAGYKLFNTGDVLTAAQVNTYLMEQTVMVFANAAARTTALSGVVSEGMISYLKDTNAVEVYDGSNWVSSDDPNAIQNTIVDAKGDLITATAADTPSRIAVGNNGETLVADSSASVGLRYQGNYAAGKNKLINGDFRINQRNFSSITLNGYGFDRWALEYNGGTATYSAQTFTPGTAPVAGYEGVNFARLTTASQSTSGSYAYLYQKIEDVRTFAGQTATISFWAKASSGTPKVSVETEQIFGTGGSPSSRIRQNFGAATLSTSWVRYTFTQSIDSISGKTLGTNNDSNLQLNIFTSAGSDFAGRTNSIGLQNTTIDIWGVQIEVGNVATAFQTATGTLAGELAACQRYYVNFNANADATDPRIGIGFASSSTSAAFLIYLPVEMRTKPSTLDWTNTAVNAITAEYAVTALSFTSACNNRDIAAVTATVASGLTTNAPYFLSARSSSKLGIGAEL